MVLSVVVLLLRLMPLYGGGACGGECVCVLCLYVRVSEMALYVWIIVTLFVMT